MVYMQRNPDNSKTITRSPYDQIKLNVIKVHSKVASEFEEYYRRKIRNGGTPPLHTISAAIMELYILVGANMRKEPGTIDAKRIKDLIMSKKEDNIIEAWELMDDWLYAKGYIKVDSIKKIDTTSWEEENDMQMG